MYLIHLDEDVILSASTSNVNESDKCKIQLLPQNGNKSKQQPNWEDYTCNISNT